MLDLGKIVLGSCRHYKRGTEWSSFYKTQIDQLDRQNVEFDSRIQGILLGGYCADRRPCPSDIQCPKDQATRVQTSTATEVILGVCHQAKSTQN